MRVPVLTAVSDAVWETELVAVLERSDLGITVVRRCVDVADLLATAAAGSARAVLLSADLRRLDREALTRLALSGVAVVGLVPAGDEASERRLRQLGLSHVLSADAPADLVASAVREAVQRMAAGASGRAAAEVGDPAAALPQPELAGADGGGGAAASGGGRVVAVWGPTGAPGRTTLAVNLAAEVARAGRATLLVDADVYGGVVAQVLGLLDEAPGLAAACRAANHGSLDVAALAGFARSLSPSMRVLSGISRADRWPELRPSALEAVLAQARHLADITVVDCGFALEQDEELTYDTAAPRRNGATRAVLEAADTVVVVGSADPVGLQRLVRALPELAEAVPGTDPVVVVNRLRSSAVPGGAADQVRASLARYAAVRHPWLVPLDVTALDAALVQGRPLADAAPSSPARRAVAVLASSLLGVPPPAARRRRPGRRARAGRVA